MKIKFVAIICFVFLWMYFGQTKKSDVTNKSQVANVEIDGLNLKKISCEQIGSEKKGFILPRDVEISGDLMKLEYVAQRVCYNGKDITKWVAGDQMKITSALRNPIDSMSAIVTTVSISGDESNTDFKSEIIYIDVSDATGEPERTVVGANVKTLDPKTSIESFTITGFDQVNKKLYFETPKWSVSSALFSIRLPADLKKTYTYQFVTDGSLNWIVGDKQKYNGYLLVEKNEVREGKGRDTYIYLVSPDGKTICEINQEEKHFRVLLECKAH